MATDSDEIAAYVLAHVQGAADAVRERDIESVVQRLDAAVALYEQHPSCSRADESTTRTADVYPRRAQPVSDAEAATRRSTRARGKGGSAAAFGIALTGESPAPVSPHCLLPGARRRENKTPRVWWRQGAAPADPPQPPPISTYSVRDESKARRIVSPGRLLAGPGSVRVNGTASMTSTAGADSRSCSSIVQAPSGCFLVNRSTASSASLMERTAGQGVPSASTVMTVTLRCVSTRSPSKIRTLPA